MNENDRKVMRNVLTVCGEKRLPLPPDDPAEARRKKLIETLKRNLNSANRCMEELERIESERCAA